MKIVVHVKRRTSFRLPAPWAVSYDVRGRHIERAGVRATTLTLKSVNNLIISSSPAALLLHRLAELHARLKPRQFPIGADKHNHLHIGSETNWTSGFWPGALWQAAALEGRPFSRWALQSTLRHLGHERTPTHDVGFMYGQSSLAAWNMLCLGRRTRSAVCSRLKRSALAAANELIALAKTNPGNGLIPVDATGPTGDTIIDSMMNIAILPWASRVTGDPAYVRLAGHQALSVALRLVRRDGSTAQAINYVRATGRVLSITTHQGLSSRSTWARGQAWAVYGFAVAASDLASRPLLRVAERTAGYVERHLPSGGVPRWDYDAPSGAPVDVSAGVITAAGLFHLASSCRQLPGGCTQSPAKWEALARRMLSASLAYASPTRPLGFLGSEDLNEHAHGCWCNDAELTLGLSYALEAVRLASGV